MKKGINFVHVLGCNLSEKEVKDITGWENYKHFESRLISNGSRIVRFLIQNTDQQFAFLTLFVGKDVYKSKSGKCQYIDDYGNMSIYLDKAPEDMNNPRPVLNGEASLTSMLQNLVNYEMAGDENTWQATMDSHGISIQNLHDNNTKGINDFLMYHAERGYTVGVLVTEKDSFDNVETHPDLFFREDNSGEVPNSFIKQLYSYFDPNAYNPIRGEIDLKAIVEQY